MITFYYNLAPNPMKVALFLEEAGLDYTTVPVDSRKGEQHSEAFKALNPNGKLPVIVDGDATVFDSNAILLYLAEKTGKFIPKTGDKARGELYSWLMFVATGIGPYSGQAVHFKHFAPKPQDYAVERYDFEALRHWSIIDARLAQHTFMLGDDYSIVDMAVWGWGLRLPFVMGEEAWSKLPNVKRLLDTINARPAAQRAEAIREKHGFKAEMDDEARRHMFPATAKSAA